MAINIFLKEQAHDIEISLYLRHKKTNMFVGHESLEVRKNRALTYNIMGDSTLTKKELLVEIYDFFIKNDYAEYLKDMKIEEFEVVA